jgi:hypothetical protein
LEHQSGKTLSSWEGSKASLLLYKIEHPEDTDIREKRSGEQWVVFKLKFVRKALSILNGPKSKHKKRMIANF